MFNSLTMVKRLYLLCPTDCLESIVRHRFKHQDYFYTSLGNSFIYDRETIAFITQMIKKHHIQEVYFVLANDNQSVLDALENQDFSDYKKLNLFYSQIFNPKQKLKALDHINNLKFLILSYYLNIKIKELYEKLRNLLHFTISIRGEIYDRQENVFTAIYSNLICLEKFHSN